MAIKRYYASKDSTISNAYKSNLVARGTSGNMGQSDILETFSIWAQANTASVERSRILIKFNTDTIDTDRVASTIPNSGSVSFFLRMYNARHGQTVPRNFTVSVIPISRSWTEGWGLDMEQYSDETTTNWFNATDSVVWTTEGGDYHDVVHVSGNSLKQYSYTFADGPENVELNITALVEEWIGGERATDEQRQNHGVGVFMSGSFEDGTTSGSFYTKKFFGRGSEFFFKRPVIEARWNDSVLDDRSDVFLSSSAVTAAGNLNKIYMYNSVRGVLTDIPGVAGGPIFVRMYNSASDGEDITTVTPNNPVTGGWVKTGIYSASFAIQTTASTVYDRWFSGSTTYFTGSFAPIAFSSSQWDPHPEYVSNITNLQPVYNKPGTARFRLYTRKKNWNPTIYTRAKTSAPVSTIRNVYWRLERVSDGLEVIGFGTGSDLQTKLSYDKEGNYFDLDMALLKTGFMYELSFLYNDHGSYQNLPQKFKFRVE